MSLLVVSLAPVLIIALYVYFRDKYEKEPIRLLLLSLFIGFVITIPIVLLENAIKLPDHYVIPVSASVAYDAFIVAAFIEEGMKWLALYWLIWRNKNFNEKFDGIVYAVFISLGFAMAENLLYVYDGGMQTGLLRAFTAVPFHAIAGVMMGYFMALAKFDAGWKGWHIFKSFMVPFVFHGLYDFFIMLGIPWVLLIWFMMMIGLWIDVFKKMKRISLDSPFRPE